MSQSRKLWEAYPRRADAGSQTEVSLLQAGMLLEQALGTTLSLLSSATKFLQPRALVLGRREFSAQLGNHQRLLDGGLVHRGQLQLQGMGPVVSSGLRVGQD